MANLTIEIPDDLVRQLEGIAAERRKTVQELALSQLQSLVEPSSGHLPGSPENVLRAAKGAPHPNPADVDELEAAIAAARLAVQVSDPFSDKRL